MLSEKSLGQFGARMKALSNRIPDNLNLVAQRTAISMLKPLVGVGTNRGTPVLTGRARGGWVAGLGGAMFGPTPLDKGGTPTINRMKESIRTSRPGDTIHISNVVHYIVLLDTTDWSPKGSFMTRKALRAARVHMRNESVLIKNPRQVRG